MTATEWHKVIKLIKYKKLQNSLSRAVSTTGGALVININAKGYHEGQILANRM